MANSELFILGDPRLLSGGKAGTTNVTYENAPPVVSEGDRVIDSKSVLLNSVGTALDSDNRLFETVASLGQQIHFGRDSYHARSWHPDSCATRMNTFIPAGEEANPTLGVEIETYLRPGITRNTMCTALRSNWFHFEEDGSLDRSLGHELITEILPPRVYRDLRFWTGLQNVASAYLESWSKDTTGLHVHVGVDQFGKCSDIPAVSRHDRVELGKLGVALVMYGYIEPSLTARVFLRKDTHYCRSAAPENMMRAIALAHSVKNLTASRMFDIIASSSSTAGYGQQVVTRMLGASTASDAIAKAKTTDYQLIPSMPEEFNGHTSELNMSHPYTIEFRRGKGTLNAVSVHRMTEFTSLLVRYVWKAARTPDMTVSSRSVYEYIIDNTSSAALVRLTGEYLDRLVKKGK